MSLDIPPAVEARTQTKMAWNRVIKERRDNVNSSCSPLERKIAVTKRKYYKTLLTQAKTAAETLGKFSITIRQQTVVQQCRSESEFLTAEGFDLAFRNEKNIEATLSWSNASHGIGLELRELANELHDSREFKNIEKQSVRLALSGHTSISYTPAYREYQFCITHNAFIKAQGFDITHDTEKKRILLSWTNGNGEGGGVASKCLKFTKEYHAKQLSNTIKDAIHRAQNSCEYKALPINVIRAWYGDQFNALAYTLQDPCIIRWR